jgi:tRNA modification GTPase
MGADGDTIFALASGSGRAAIGVVRLSGARCADIISRLAAPVPPPRRATLRPVRSGSAEIIDFALVLWLPGPGSYTGEDSGELHIHGGRAVIEAVTAALLNLGARPAEPGEFTRRAFMNGRMGLLEAEAVADLVDAETEAQRRQALRQMDGAQGSLITAWAERVRRLLAWQEALIDFPDDDLPPAVESTLTEDLAALRAEIERGIEDSARGIRLRDGLMVAVTGAANVGKSSLVNVLAGRDVAIVSPLPGTTRDALEVTMDFGGVPVTLIDTAGLRDTDDPVEAEGVRRARARAASADLVLEVRDASAPSTVIVSDQPSRILVFNKADVAPVHDGLGVSALTGEGIDALRARLSEQAATLAHVGANPVFTRARHAAALRDAASALATASACALPELRGEELRVALAALARVTGTVDVEMVLDLVFSQFCIGK